VASTPDFYKVLQVDRSAEPEVIEAAYKRLASKYHPDHDHGVESGDRMRLINEAYEVLSNPRKRSDYDRTGRVEGRAGRVHQGRTAGWLRYVIPALFIVVTIAGFRATPRAGLVSAAAFCVYIVLRSLLRKR